MDNVVKKWGGCIDDFFLERERDRERGNLFIWGCIDLLFYCVKIFSFEEIGYFFVLVFWKLVLCIFFFFYIVEVSNGGWEMMGGGEKFVFYFWSYCEGGL